MDPITEAAIEELRNGTADLTTAGLAAERHNILSKWLDGIAMRLGRIESETKALDWAVAQARVHGASWSEVGMAAGMSKQAAHKRWGGDHDVEVNGQIVDRKTQGGTPLGR